MRRNSPQATTLTWAERPIPSHADNSRSRTVTTLVVWTGDFTHLHLLFGFKQLADHHAPATRTHRNHRIYLLPRAPAYPRLVIPR